MQFGNAGGLLLNIDTASWFKVTQSTRPKKRQPLIALTSARSAPCRALVCRALGIFLPNAIQGTEAEQMMKCFLGLLNFFSYFFMFLPLRLPHPTPADPTCVGQRAVSSGVHPRSSDVSLSEPSSIQYLHPDAFCPALV